MRLYPLDGSGVTIRLRRIDQLSFLINRADAIRYVGGRHDADEDSLGRLLEFVGIDVVAMLLQRQLFADPARLQLVGNLV